MSEKVRLFLLIGGGSCVPWVTETYNPEKIDLVGAASHKKHAAGLDWFRERGRPHALLPFVQLTRGAGQSRDAYMSLIETFIWQCQPDLVLALGWDLILPGGTLEYLRSCGTEFLNLHPALVSPGSRDVPLPGYDPVPVIKGEVSDVMKEVLRRKLPVAGASIHYLNATVDEGVSVLQHRTKVRDDDTPESLEQRVHELEKELVQQLLFNIEWSGLEQALKNDL